MYLPTFWKLCMENRLHSMKHVAPWVLPPLFMCKNEILNLRHLDQLLLPV